MDVFWLATGQGLSAFGMLVGTRLLTEWMPPAAYGEAMLWLGVIALAHGSLVLPYLQSVLRHFVEAEATGQTWTLRAEATAQIGRIALLGGGLLLVGILLFHTVVFQGIGVGSGWLGKALLGLAAGGLLSADILRSGELTFLNAAGKQLGYSVFVAIDMWLRPILAVVAVVAFAPTATSVIGGYACASLLTAMIRHWPVRLEFPYFKLGRWRSSVWQARLLGFAQPLRVLALLGWITGLADRYLLASLAELPDVGIYAALYGLVSRPFLVISVTTELAFRQALYSAVATTDRLTVRRTLSVWIMSSASAALALVVLFALGHDWLVRILLGDAYHARSDLMVWIAIGQMPLVLANAVERVSYAAGKTRLVVVTQGVGALSSVLIATPAIYCRGIEGAAMSVPIYCGLQLLTAVLMAKLALGVDRKLWPVVVR